MCNRAGSLIGNVIESYGISTVQLSINRPMTEKMPAARNGFIKFPFGASFGEPGRRAQQAAILRDLFRLLETADKPGVIVDLPHQWRRTKYEGE